MDSQTRARYEARAKVIKALAHPTRLFIIDRLAQEGEKCVCDLTGLVGADMSTVSKHLALLKEAGILQDEKRGSMVFYRIRVNCVLNFFECIETVLLGRAEAQQKLFAPEEQLLAEGQSRAKDASSTEMAFS